MSKYRPYTEKDMPAVHLCAVRRKSANYIYNQIEYVYTIVGWYNAGVQLSTGFHHSYSYLLENFEFLDGSPCGVEENDIRIN